MLTILLVEDEKYTRKYLKTIIEGVPLVGTVIEAASGNEAVQLSSEYKPDIVITDIELDLPGKINGIEAAKLITDLYPHTQFIFVTGYSKYALDSFEVHPYDYILKPVKPEKLAQSIVNLASKIKEQEQNLSKQQGKLIVKIKKETLFIPFEKILFIEKRGNEVLLHTAQSTYPINQNLNEIQDIFPENFLRVHKSYIVNTAEIEKVEELDNRSYQIYFSSDKHQAQMSRYKYEEFKQLFAPSFKQRKV